MSADATAGNQHFELESAILDHNLDYQRAITA
jgi:hypothetical protein